jgi:hypothetical protein
MGKKKGACSISNKDTNRIPPLPLPSELDHNGNGMYVDPARIRFQHSRIRPYFSGCGRSVTATLEEIRNGTIQVSDLPPIQVIAGPSNNNVIGDDKNANEPWYFSLNNRRLWVLKRLREEGLLERYDNKVFVRVRMPKSRQEQERYCLDNCALEAKIVLEKSVNKNKGSKKAKSNQLLDDDSSLDEKQKEKSSGQDSEKRTMLVNSIAPWHSDKSEADDDDDDDANIPSNRFSALLLC